MKVLHVEAGRHLYGGALQVRYLLEGLSRQCGNILVCPRGSAIADAARDDVQQLYTLPMRGDADVALIAQLRKIIRHEKPDIVHLHSRRGADLLGGLAARGCGCKVILTRRVDNPEPSWWVRLKYHLFDHIITISQGIRDVLLHEGVAREKITCVHSAVDTQRFAGSCDRFRFVDEFGLPEDGPVIAMVAQFIERKGHRYLLEAIPEVIGRFPRAKFLLFGRGPLHDSINDQIRQSDVLSACVTLAGFRDDLERILPCVTMLVHPADMEGLGVSLLQAAACGVPIVATAVGGIPEIVKDDETGYLIPPASPRPLADAMIKILTDREHARQMGIAGRKLVEQSFSVAAMVSGNLAVYDRLLTVSPAQANE